ncbi:tetratricopeptide repeat protein [Qipengyuania aquimaris]|nr:tetratricopeptide repeat protein [Qipengyuania aquimaris]
MDSRPVSTAPQDWHARANAAERGGDIAGGRKLLEQGLAEHPGNAQLHNSAGSMAMRAGDAAAAEAAFARAIALDPSQVDYSLNRAIALGKLGRSREALALLREKEAAAGSIAKYWSIRGNTARAAGDSADAAMSYDRCLVVQPGHAKALHGRARVALDRGEDQAVTRFDIALSVNQAEADLWLGKAQALDAAGDHQQARSIAEQLVEHAPHWLEALKLLAQLRLGMGDEDYAGHYREAAARLPADPNIPTAHAEQLAGLDHAAEAAEVVAEARKRFPDSPQFALMEAVHAGAAGDQERAEAIFADLQLDTPDRAIHEARHRIRRGELERAESLLEKALAGGGSIHSTYALLGMVWRLTGNPKAHWLHEQENLVQLRPLRDAESIMPQAIERLHELHDHSPLPLGQSLRGGSQTRHILFQRHEEIFARLHRAILGTLEDYRAALPPADPDHPLLRNRDDPWELTGSWSVRLRGGGDYHTSHIHPDGMLSSALYLIVPEAAQGDDKQGWLEVGRPPPHLGLDLPPLRTIQPKEGHLALFPSTLYHGTTPFEESLRMTVAFDVVPVARPAA